MSSLFEVYLRLRPTLPSSTDSWLRVEPPTHITLQPPNDSRKRAIERFGFTNIFDGAASQSEIFEHTGTAESIRQCVERGRDGLIATLGVTGSGKSHTIFGTRLQRGVAQMALDTLFRSVGPSLKALPEEIQLSDTTEANVQTAQTFFDTVYDSGERSRAQTPMTDITISHSTRKPPLPNANSFPQQPDVSSYAFEADDNFDYAVVLSMYEVYNDRIFDLLSTASNIPASQTRQGAALSKSMTRRALLFKNTEKSPDHKVVAGLRKIFCTSYIEAMQVLEAGLHERRVAGTGSNSVSSRSHGFFCVEIKKRHRGRRYVHDDWSSATLSIVDLAGSERARNAKTTGSTLAEAGKINESLMYLGQCLQVQSDCQQDGSKPIVPFRQCKLTELLFSNSFPTGNGITTHKQPQKAIMIVTADPQGDFNATSQILRYSALAREVTVPRIPSVQHNANALSGRRPTMNNHNGGRQTPDSNSDSNSDSDLHLHFQRLADENEQLQLKLKEAEIRHAEADLRAHALEERLANMEQSVRDECYDAMEEMMETKERWWRAALDEERCRHQDFVDDKIGISQRVTELAV